MEAARPGGSTKGARKCPSVCSTTASALEDASPAVSTAGVLDGLTEATAHLAARNDANDSSATLLPQAVVGFSSGVTGGLVLDPTNDDLLIFPRGDCVVLRDLKKNNEIVLQEHTSLVSCLAVSHDGRTLATGQSSKPNLPGDILLWSMSPVELRHKLRVHKETVLGISFSPSDAYIASIGAEGSIVVWEVSTGQAVCGSPAVGVTSLVFFSEDSLCTGGDQHHHIRFWRFDVAIRKLGSRNASCGPLRRVTRQMKSIGDEVVCAATASGDVVLISTARGNLLTTGPPRHLFAKGLTAIEVIRGCGDLLVGSGDGTLARLRKDNLSIMNECVVRGGITSIAATKSGLHGYVATDRGELYWLDTLSLTLTLRWTSHTKRVNIIRFPDGISAVFASAADSSIRIWATESLKQLVWIELKGLECYDLNFYHNGDALLSGWSDGRIRAFGPESGSCLYTIDNAHDTGVTAISLFHGDKWIASGGMKGEIRVWEIKRDCHQLEVHLKEHRAPVTSIVIDRDGSNLLTASQDGSVILWDANKWTRRMCFFESTVICGALYHPEETQIVTGGSNKHLMWWDTESSKPLRTVETEGAIQAIALSESGCHILTAMPNALQIWDYIQGEPIGRCALARRTTALAMRDGFLVTGSDAGTLNVWKLPDIITAAVDPLAATN